MEKRASGITRRRLLRSSAGGALGGLLALHFPQARRAVAQVHRATPQSQAALAAGETRADNVLRALRLIEGRIKQGLAAKKLVVLKPNMVLTDVQLAATHVDCLDAVLDFITPLFKGDIIIADSAASGSVAKGYENYDYHRLQKKYNVKLLDLDEEPIVIHHAVDQRFHAQPVRMSRILLDPDAYLISAAIPKTHDRAVVTLSLKNVVVGAAIKDRTFRWGASDSGSNDKMFIHGGPANEGIHYNLFQLSKQLHPHLSVLDGFQGMEHNGPCGGTAVDHKIAIASTDWLAADRVAVELMGFDFAKVGYLTFAARAGLGQGDLTRIDVLGEKVADHVRRYRPHDNIEQQYKWMSRA